MFNQEAPFPERFLKDDGSNNIYHRYSKRRKNVPADTYMIHTVPCAIQNIFYTTLLERVEMISGREHNYLRLSTYTARYKTTARKVMFQRSVIE